MSESSSDAGRAALTLLESLLIHLGETRILSAEDISTVYRAAIDAHRNADIENGTSEHERVAQLLEKVETGRNGVRLGH